MATVYHAVAVQLPEGARYGVVGVVDNSSATNPNFVYDFSTSYVRAASIAAALNGAGS